MYYQMINEQEQADARVAKQLADRLGIETERERTRQAEYNEQLARRLQDELLIGSQQQQHHHHHQQQLPPPIPRSELPPKKQAPPPALPPPSLIKPHHRHIDERTPQPPQLNYVSLNLENGQRVHRTNPATQYTEIVPQPYNLQAHTPEKKSSGFSRNSRPDDIAVAVSPELGACGLSSPSQMSPGYAEVYPNRASPHKHSNQSSIDLSFNVSSTQSGALQIHQMGPPVNHEKPRHHHYVDTQPSSIGLNLDTDRPSRNNRAAAAAATNQNDIEAISRYVDSSLHRAQQLRVEKLSPEKFDYLMGNKLDALHLDQYDGASSAADGAAMYVNSGAAGQQQSPPMSPHRHNHSVLLSDEYSPNDRIKTMQELGVPADEILEIDRRITQEERDEVLFCFCFK